MNRGGRIWCFVALNITFSECVTVLYDHGGLWSNIDSFSRSLALIHVRSNKEVVHGIGSSM